jgi:hypothetical protein
LQAFRLREPVVLGEAIQEARELQGGWTACFANLRSVPLVLLRKPRIRGRRPLTVGFAKQQKDKNREVLNMQRTLLFGDPAAMGTDEEVTRELCELDAAEAAREQEEAEVAAAEAEAEAMARRKLKNNIFA